MYAADKTSADAASNDLSGGSHGVAPIEIARSESAHQPVLSVCIEEHAVPIIVASDAATGEARWWHPLQGPCSGLFALHSTALVFSDLRRGRLRLLQLLPGPTPSSAPEATSHSAFVEGLGCIACDLASGTVFVSARRRVRGQRGPVAVVLAYAVLSGRLVEQGIVSGAGDSRSDRVLVVMPPSSDGSTAARLVIGDGESFSLIVLALPQRSFVQTIECRSPSGTRGGGVMSLAIARDGSLLVSHAGGVSCLAWPPIDSRCPPADPETVATSVRMQASRGTAARRGRSLLYSFAACASLRLNTAGWHHPDLGNTCAKLRDRFGSHPSRPQPRIADHHEYTQHLCICFASVDLSRARIHRCGDAAVADSLCIILGLGEFTNRR